MEKLKAKHDHKLTDILKVMIFALFLILPGLIVLPSMLYYGVNEHATAPTEEVEVYEYKQINFNQKFNTQGTYINTSMCTSINSGSIIWDDFIVPVNSRNLFDYYPFILNHKYYVKNLFNNNITNTPLPRLYFNGSYKTLAINDNQYFNFIFTATDTRFVLGFSSSYSGETFNNQSTLNIFDLTQMFGEGNEPTEQEFNTWFTNNYYPYNMGENMTLEIDTGNTETYTDITSQIQYNWTSLWKQPLFSWTNYTIVKQGIDNFTGVFGITNTSNISNLIAYELIIVAIYIVIDIVLTLFKWLTHLIGEK